MTTSPVNRQCLNKSRQITYLVFLRKPAPIFVLVTERSRQNKRHLMKISAATEKVGLPVKTVHYCSDIGLGKPAALNAAGYRDHDHTAL